MYYCYIFIITTFTTFLLSYLYFNEKKENDKLRKEIKRLKQELKNLMNQKEEEMIREVENILKITEGYSKYEDGKLYLTGEALKRLKTEWKVSRDEVKKRLEELGLSMIGRTTKSINGEIRHAYIYLISKKEV